MISVHDVHDDDNELVLKRLCDNNAAILGELKKISSFAVDESQQSLQYLKKLELLKHY